MTKQLVLTMYVGVPGSGKSTYLDNLEKNVMKNDLYYVASSDRFLEAWAEMEGLTYQEVFKDRIGEATSRMYDEVKEAIQNRLDIHWDQTNLTVKGRKKKLDLFPNHYYKQAIFFNNPANLYDRLDKRERETGKHIPDHVIQQMIDSAVVPTFEEGFEKIIIVDDMDGQCVYYKEYKELLLLKRGK